MKTYTEDFSEALSSFAENGGAMNYDAGMWLCDEYELIKETTGDAKQATIAAMQRGGLSDNEINTLISGWTEEA